ncbi:AAA family ATPase [Microbacterium sp. LMI1-1-1.1]|uniref:AAA family ATPase n=1 Tax=Microbacterium sp. LMI1-1-1.1 TaxID=3135223 RepID=UPI00346731C3
MSPRLYVVVGCAGSGKSTVAEAIARTRRAAYLDKDAVADEFTTALLRAVGTDPHGREDNAYYQQVVMDVEYATLLRVASGVLGVGLDVVLDAPFGRYLSQPDFLERTAWEHDWPDDLAVVVVRVTADERLVRERITARGLDRDAWKLAHWDRFWASAQAVECRWRGARQVLIDNGDRPVDPVVIERTLADAMARPLSLPAAAARADADRDPAAGVPDVGGAP